jgi:hypothetical protein
MSKTICYETCCREKQFTEEVSYLASLAVGTFESYLQDTGKWDDLKEFKELMENHCPNHNDFEEMFSHYWGHRVDEEEDKVSE